MIITQLSIFMIRHGALFIALCLVLSMVYVATPELSCGETIGQWVWFGEVLPFTAGYMGVPDERRYLCKSLKIEKIVAAAAGILILCVLCIANIETDGGIGVPLYKYGCVVVFKCHFKNARR